MKACCLHRAQTVLSSKQLLIVITCLSTFWVECALFYRHRLGFILFVLYKIHIFLSLWAAGVIYTQQSSILHVRRTMFAVKCCSF